MAGAFFESYKERPLTTLYPLMYPLTHFNSHKPYKTGPIWTGSNPARAPFLISGRQRRSGNLPDIEKPADVRAFLCLRRGVR